LEKLCDTFPHAQPLVSGIVVNWNGKEYLGECLDSLRRQTFPDFEVIVVDNGSTDGSVDYVESQFPGFARILRNAENTGFSRGNNQGIKVVKGQYIALLNNDARAGRHWLEELVRAAEADHRTGMLASKIHPRGSSWGLSKAGHLMYRNGRARGEQGKEEGHFCE
jgi:GT2 family glycosyltransferase